MAATSRWFSLALVLFVIGSVRVAGAADAPGIELFEKKIRPVLVESCYKCHSAQAKELKAGLLLDTREGIRRGGETGPAVVPKNVKKSLLISALRHDDFEMPPDRKLAEQTIADFVQWINMGAPDPRDGTARLVQEEIDLEKGREFWCFQPVREIEVPRVKDTSWPRADVDRFVLAKLEEKGLRPVEDAAAMTVARRLYFDLIGLPPTPEQLVEFQEESRRKSRDAIEALVDRLLDSPQFGERWGRHWLDVARYAESNGNTRNATFPHAWRYRDYVIEAFNRDTPYDRFVVEQIAGDLLPYDSVDERNRNLTATGLLALGSKPVIRGKKGGFVPDIASDQIEVTTRSILALTVACARCHDHKFDPIPTTDFYGLAGIFASSETLYGGGGKTMGGAPATELHVLADKDSKKAKAYEDWKNAVAAVQKKQREVNQQLKKLRPKRDKKQNAAKRNKPPAADSKTRSRVAELTRQVKQLATELKSLQRKAVQPPAAAMGVREAASVNEVPIYVRGESPKGSPVPRGFVTVASDGEPALSDSHSGRLELAQWLSSPDNPLTARVMVNRIWLHLFGEGIVRTPDNFGLNGDRPTHPELLDWLARRFVENGWSVKKMIRELVLTRAYQLSVQHDAGNYEIDPDNLYVWRHSRRRLAAEVIRDSLLAASGQLELDPPQGSVVSKHGNKLIQDGFTPETIHEPSNHRSVYLPILRNGLPEVLEVFDVADPSLVVGRRTVTTVPAQDLFLMNSPFVVQQSEQLAQRLLDAESDDAARVELAYLRCLSRPPNRGEADRATAYVEQAAGTIRENGSGDAARQAAWASLCQALFVSAEFRHTD